MAGKNKLYDDNQLLATIVKMTLGTVMQKLAIQGREFYLDQELFDGKTLLEEARTEIMYNILEEIAQNIQRPLIEYTDQQKYDEKSKTFYLVKEKTILLDPKTIKVIEKSLDKAIVQMAKEVNKNIDEIHKQAVKKAIGSNTEPPQMNDLRYSEYLLEAGATTNASKFIAEMEQNKLDKETRNSFKELMSSFKVAVRKVLSRSVSSMGAVSTKAIKVSEKPGKMAEKVADLRRESDKAPLLTR